MLKVNNPRLTQGLLSSLIAIGLFSGLIAVTPAAGQVPVSQVNNGTVIVKGKVADVFGDRFVLEDSSGRVLVQTPAGTNTLSVTTGETVTVVGLPRDRIFDAAQILRDNGEVVFAAPPPPPPSSTSPLPQQAPLPPQPTGALRLPPPPRPPGGDALLTTNVDRDAMMRALQQTGLTAVSEPVRHPKHIEMTARTSAGKYVVVSFDRFGRLDEIEDIDHDNKRIAEARAIGPAEAGQLAQQAGFTPREPVERRKHHYEIIAASSSGELIELHMDLAGTIYKRVWIR